MSTAFVSNWAEPRSRPRTKKKDLTTHERGYGGKKGHFCSAGLRGLQTLERGRASGMRIGKVEEAGGERQDTPDLVLSKPQNYCTAYPPVK